MGEPHTQQADWSARSVPGQPLLAMHFAAQVASSHEAPLYYHTLLLTEGEQPD